MAVFGVPTVHEDDALRAVRAASEMRERLAKLNDELEQTTASALEMRVGVNTGEVVAGDASAGHDTRHRRRRRRGQATGGSGAAGQILIGKATYPLVSMQSRRARARSFARRASRPASTRAVSTRSAPTAPVWRKLDAPLVDRRAELQRLRAASTRRGQPPPAARDHPRTGRNRQVPAGERAPRGGPPRGDDPRGPLSRLRRRHHVLAACRGVVRSATDDLTDKGSQAALREGHRPRRREDRGDDRRRRRRRGAAEETFWAVRRFLEQLALERPLVVTIDELQWAEPTFVDLLDYLVGWLARRRF